MRKPFFLKSRKTWYLKINRPGGKVQTVPVGATKAEAYDTWRQMMNAAESAGDNDHLVVELVTKYVAHQKKRVELDKVGARTVREWTINLIRFCKFRNDEFAISELPISKLRNFHVTAWLDSESKWNATTRHHGAEAVKRVTKWALREGFSEVNPIAELREQKGPPRDHVIDRSEYEVLHSGIRQNNRCRKSYNDFRIYLIGLWLSGCRPSEMASLQVGDFDGVAWTVRIHKNRRKKKNKPRKVYLSPCLNTVSRIAENGRTDGPLFQKADHDPWKYHDLRQRFMRLKKRVKVSNKCVLYSFRHSWITNAVIATGDVATVATLAGTSIRMIDEHYGHLASRDDHLIETAAKINAAKTAAVRK